MDKSWSGATGILSRCTSAHENQRRLGWTCSGALSGARTCPRRWRPSQASRLHCCDGQIAASGARTPETLSEREDRHMTLQSKQSIGTERFTEVAESTDFQKGTYLHLRQKPGPPGGHVPPLHSQVLEPPNLGEHLVQGRGQKQQAQSDSTAGVSQKLSKPSGSDET